MIKIELGVLENRRPPVVMHGGVRGLKSPNLKIVPKLLLSKGLELYSLLMLDGLLTKHVFVGNSLELVHVICSNVYSAQQVFRGTSHCEWDLHWLL